MTTPPDVRLQALIKRTHKIRQDLASHREAVVKFRRASGRKLFPSESSILADALEALTQADDSLRNASIRLLPLEKD